MKIVIEIKEDVVSGRNAVLELLKTGRDVDKLYIRRGERSGSLQVIVATALNRKIPVIEVDAAKLDALTGGANHQGVAASAAAVEYAELEDIFAAAEAKGEKPFIVIADGIEDPQNLGALIRCAEGAGAHGVIIGKRRAVGLTGAVEKASAGAVEHIPIDRLFSDIIGRTDLPDTPVDDSPCAYRRTAQAKHAPAQFCFRRYRLPRAAQTVPGNLAAA